MKITVITVAYNCAEVIARTLASAAAQTWPDLEHLVVDGDSQDYTLEVIRSFADRHPRMRWLSEPDDGIYAAMNKGIRQATGDVIAILNAGDWYADPDYLSRVVAAFRQNPQAAAVYGDLLMTDPEAQRLVRFWESGPFDRARFFRGWDLPHPAFFVRRSVHLRYGFYDARLAISADYELLVRLFVRHRLQAVWLPGAHVVMPLGGRSNATLRARIQGNLEVLRAWHLNGLWPPLRLMPGRVVEKVAQYRLARSLPTDQSPAPWLMPIPTA